MVEIVSTDLESTSPLLLEKYIFGFHIAMYNFVSIESIQAL
jgi:hypothetical protein